MAKSASKTGMRPGKGGIFPPVEHQFKPGNTASPGRPPAAGGSIREFLNIMQTWTKDELQTCFDAPATGVAKRAAARVWLDAISNVKTDKGLPVAGSDFDRIMGHTDLPLSELVKNQRLDDGKATERFEGVTLRVEGVTPKD